MFINIKAKTSNPSPPPPPPPTACTAVSVKILGGALQRRQWCVSASACGNACGYEIHAWQSLLQSVQLHWVFSTPNELQSHDPLIFRSEVVPEHLILRSESCDIKFKRPPFCGRDRSIFDPGVAHTYQHFGVSVPPPPDSLCTQSMYYPRGSPRSFRFSALRL